MRHILSFAVCLFFAQILFAQPKRIYVDAYATGAHTGKHWDDAFTDLSSALAVAQAGDSIWVALGIYTPPTNMGRTACFLFPSGVRLFGGFSGVETSLEERDWQKFKTQLSGDLGSPDDTTDNAYNILYMERPALGTIVDGCYFTGGRANATHPGLPTTDRLRCGGAIYILGEGGVAYPDIRNCTFEDNSAERFGGAVFAYNNYNGSIAPRFLNCTFRNNRAHLGAGIYRFGGSVLERSPDFGDCIFEKGVGSGGGGGLYFVDTEGADTIKMSRCTFRENVSDRGSAAVFSLGRTTSSKLQINGCLFEKNVPTSPFLNNTGPVQISSSLYTSYLNIRGCTFRENAGRSMLYIDVIPKSIVGGPLNTQVVDSCRFEKNQVESSCIFSQGLGRMRLTNTIFAHNTMPAAVATSATTEDVFCENLHFQNNVLQLLTNSSSPRVFFYFDAAVNQCKFNNILFEKNGLAGAMYITISNGSVLTPEFVNCTFARNYFLPNISASNASAGLKFQNCAFFKNENYHAHLFKQFSNGAHFDHCAFDTLDTDHLPTTVTLGPGCFQSRDMQFQNASDSLSNYRLQACSPLIEAGSNTGIATSSKDLAGSPRIRNNFTDIGAYEATAFLIAGEPLPQPSCADGASGAYIVETTGCPPLQYAWDNGSATGTSPTGLAPGTYTFTITDAKNRQMVRHITIGTGVHTVTLATTPLACGSTVGGVVAASATGGILPYTYAWSNGAISPTITGLPIGAYTVTITDASGCKISQSAQVSSLGDGLTVLPGSFPVSCFGAANGVLTATPFNGLPPYTYSWNDGQTNSAAVGLHADVYSVTVTDALGCTGGFAQQVSSPEPIAITGSPSPASGVTVANGGVTITDVSGGTAPFTYHWNTGSSEKNLTNVLPNIYTLTITDAQGCTADKTFDVQFVSGAGSPQQSIAWQAFPNPAAAFVNLKGDAPHANAPLRYELLDAAGQTLSNGPIAGLSGYYSQKISLEALPSGIFYLRLTDASGWTVGAIRVCKK